MTDKPRRLSTRPESNPPRHGSATADELPLAGIEDQPDPAETLARQSSIAFSGDVVRRLIGFTTLAVITRLVSPSVYGLFVLALAIMQFVQALASLGLPKAVDYFVPQYLQAGERGKARAVIIEVTALVLVTSILTALAIIIMADGIAALFAEPGLATVLVLLTVTIPLLALYNVILACFNAIKRLRYRVYTRDFTRPLIRLAATTGILLAGYGILGLIGGYFLGLLAAIFVGALLLGRRVPQLARVRASPVSAGPLLWYSVPLAFASVIYVVLGQVDSFIIGYFATSADVGIYRIGYSVAANLLIIFVSVSPVFKPLIAEARTDNRSVEEQFRTAVRWMMGLTIPMAIVLALGAEAYLSIVFTPQYAVASLVVVVLSGGYLVSVTSGGPDGALLQGLGYSRLVFLNTALLLVTNVVVSALLVPPLGITGAAIGTASALSVAGIAALLEVYVLRGIHPFSPSILKLPVAALPAIMTGGVVVVLAPGHLAVALVLPIVVLITYGAGLVALRAFTEQDEIVARRFSPRAGRLVVRLRRAGVEKPAANG